MPAAPSTPAPPSKAPAALVPPPEPVRPIKPIEEPPKYVKQAVKAATEAASEDAQKAQAKGKTSSSCTEAFAGLEAAVLELQRAKAPGAPRAMPPKARFLQTCESLPPEAQQCLVMGYAVDNQTHCQQVEASLAPAERNALKALLSSPKSSSQTGSRSTTGSSVQ